MKHTWVLDSLAQLRRVRRRSDRWAARIGYCLDRERRLAPRRPMTLEQLNRYREDGCLLVPGLLPNPIVAAARHSMWEAVGGEPNSTRSWSDYSNSPLRLTDLRIRACFTPNLLACAAHLSGESPASFAAPRAGYTVNVFPQPRPAGRYCPHVDHSNSTARHRSFPRPFRIAALIYLTDVKPDGGQTLVWPGSHRLVRALARAHPRRFRLMMDLNAAVASELELGSPRRLRPAAGDVLFYDPFCVHSGSANLSESARFALNQKW